MISICMSLPASLSALPMEKTECCATPVFLMVETTESSDEPVVKILHWLSTKGIGLVVNPLKEYPDYVFPWGMIWNFKETNLFRLNQPPVIQGTVELKNEQGLIAGPPHPKYLPDYVRSILKQFFMDQGLMQVKILVLM